MLWGSNARETHPIFFHHLLKGVRNGARLYAVDPRRTSSAEWADVWLGLDVGSDIALANAVGREIIHAGLANQEFIDRATSDFEAYKAKVETYTLEYAERITYTDQKVDDALFARVKKHFNEPQIVELTAAVALENFRSKFNPTLGIEAQGFCLLPRR